MRFSTDIDAAPRNTPLLLRVRVSFDGGNEHTGIGVIQVHTWDANTHETVQFSFVNERGFDTTPPGVSTPSGVALGDIVEWMALPSPDEDFVADLAYMDRCFVIMEKAMTSARDRLASAAEYADSATVNSTIATVADDLHAALKEVL